MNRLPSLFIEIDLFQGEHIRRLNAVLGSLSYDSLSRKY